MALGSSIITYTTTDGGFTDTYTINTIAGAGAVELYTVANVLSRAPYEAEDRQVGLANYTATKDIEYVNTADGTWSLKLAGGTGGRVDVAFTAEVGKTYEVEYYLWCEVGSTMEVRTWSGISPSVTYQLITSTTPQIYTSTVTASSTSMILRFYYASGTLGGYVDGLSIKEV